MADAYDTAAAEQTGEYVVVARRYRPQAFTQLIGQEHVARGLTNAIESHRVGHAYLFTGARGVGKTSTARILAKALDCVHGPTPAPCNECEICRGVSSGDDVDVLEIDGASNRGIDEIRQLRQNANVRPSRARFKIYIIDEVHMLTREAFNALLKTLEEPPEHVKFIFCTTEAEKIPITILSRCQRFDFAGIQTSSIAGRLRQIVDAEGVQADAEALELLARRAAGSMRDSQSLLEQLLAFGKGAITAADVHEMLGTANDARLGQITRALVAHDPTVALAELDAAMTEGVDPGQLLEQLLGYLRDCMAAAVGCKTDSFLHTSPAEFAAVQEAGKQLGLETILAVIGIIDQTLSRLRYSTHARVLAEMALVRACKLEDLDALPAAIAQLRSGATATMPAVAQRAAAAPPTRPTPAADDSKKKAPELAAAAPTVAHPHTAENLAPPAIHVNKPAAETSVAKPPVAISHPAASETASRLSIAGDSASQTSVDNINSQLASAYDASAESFEYHDVSAATPAQVRSTPAVLAVSAHDLPSTAGPSSSDTVAADVPRPLTADQVPAIWQQMLAELSGMTAGYAQNAVRVSLAGADRLAVHFSARHNFAKLNCEKPEQLGELQRVLADVAGRPVRLEFHTVADEPAAAKAVKSDARRSAGPSRQRQAEISDHPLVRKASELFDARVVRIDETHSV